MRKLLIVFVLFSLVSCQNKTERTSLVQQVSDLGLVPRPQQIELKKGYFEFNKNTKWMFKSEMDLRIRQAIEEMGLSANMEPLDASKAYENAVVFSKIESDTLSDEAYFLKINCKTIIIKSKSAEGFFYALQTLRQMLPDTIEKYKTYPVQAVKIFDQPEFVWRGAHLDVCRHFFPKAFIKKYIDQLAKHKMNIFHWHLTEDQGWRIEIKKYPLLTTVGSKRSETIVEKNFDPFVGDGIPYEGFYTQEDIKEIVAYAQDRFVTIVPEIEMPGHSLAALAAYPELACKKGSFQVGTKWGVYDDVYCAGKDSVFYFLQDVLDEVLDLFPSPYIHIGGDECPKTRWKTCDKCQARIQAEGLKDEQELQSYFIKRIEQYLLTKGRNIIGWDEILEGGLAPQASVMSWRGEAGGIEAAKQRHNVVMTPGKPCYFDHYQSEDKNSEPLAIGGFNSLEAVYRYNPIPEALPAENRSYILGAQANVWTEYMPNSEQVEYMVFPRLCALSEVVWTGEKNKDFKDFETRMQKHYRRLQSWGIHYRK